MKKEFSGGSQQRGGEQQSRIPQERRAVVSESIKETGRSQRAEVNTVSKGLSSREVLKEIKKEIASEESKAFEQVLLQMDDALGSKQERLTVADRLRASIDQLFARRQRPSPEAYRKFLMKAGRAPEVFAPLAVDLFTRIRASAEERGTEVRDTEVIGRYAKPKELMRKYCKSLPEVGTKQRFLIDRLKQLQKLIPEDRGVYAGSPPPLSLMQRGAFSVGRLLSRVLSPSADEIFSACQRAAFELYKEGDFGDLTVGNLMRAADQISLGSAEDRRQVSQQLEQDPLVRFL